VWKDCEWYGDFSTSIPVAAAPARKIAADQLHGNRGAFPIVLKDAMGYPVAMTNQEENEKKKVLVGFSRRFQNFSAA
jgi:hypothetical protein